VTLRGERRSISAYDALIGFQTFQRVSDGITIGGTGFLDGTYQQMHRIIRLGDSGRSFDGIQGGYAVTVKVPPA
jgi:hypothetical protein